MARRVRSSRTAGSPPASGPASVTIARAMCSASNTATRGQSQLARIAASPSASPASSPAPARSRRPARTPHAGPRPAAPPRPWESAPAPDRRRPRSASRCIARSPPARAPLSCHPPRGPGLTRAASAEAAPAWRLAICAGCTSQPPGGSALLSGSPGGENLSENAPTGYPAPQAAARGGVSGWAQARQKPRARWRPGRTRSCRLRGWRPGPARVSQVQAAEGTVN
jgi:hypothetical protein